MLWFAVAIAGMIGLAAISHRLLCHYLTSSESQTHKPKSQDKNQNKAGCTEQEVTFCISDGTDVQPYSILEDLFASFMYLLLESSCYEVMRIPESHCYERRVLIESRCFGGSILDGCQPAAAFYSNPFDDLEWRKPVLGNVMEALTDPNTHLIGVYGSQDEIKETLLERVTRRIQRDSLFDLVLTASATRKPDVKKIQDELAHQLGFIFSQKSKDKRANELNDRIKNEQSILIILRDLYKELDLSKVGIPYGTHHMGCKILLTSTSEHVLFHYMHTHKNFMV